MPTDRSEVMGGIWADGAPDPVTPVTGITYANSALTEADIEEGLPFAEVLESAKLNEVLRRVTALLTLLENWGVLPWSPATNYEVGARAVGSNGKLYYCILNAFNQDPTVSPTYWSQDPDLLAHAALTAPHSAASAATANRLVVRDAAGRAKFAPGIATGDATVFSQFASVQAANGYQKLPGGLIIQWGVAETSGYDNEQITVTFPLAFPNNCLFVMAGGQDSGTLGALSNAAVKVVSWTKTQAVMNVDRMETGHDETVYPTFIAIGN